MPDPGTSTPDETQDAVSLPDFRDAMRRFGAAVHIVTTAGKSGEAGYTGSAVCSVSDDPPTLLVCLHRESRANAAFKENGAFCVNTLAADQQALSNAFAGFTGLDMADRFALGKWGTLKTGAPVLDTCLVALDCELTDVVEVATHSVMFGRVVDMTLGERKPALVYLDRTYHAV